MNIYGYHYQPSPWNWIRRMTWRIWYLWLFSMAQIQSQCCWTQTSEKQDAFIKVDNKKYNFSGLWLSHNKNQICGSTSLWLCKVSNNEQYKLHGKSHWWDATDNANDSLLCNMSFFFFRKSIQNGTSPTTWWLHYGRIDCVHYHGDFLNHYLSSLYSNTQH